MLGRMSRGLCVAVLALAFSGWAAAQEPKKPEAKPEAKPEIKKPEVAPQEKKAEEGKDIIATAMDAKLATFVDLVKLAGLTDELKKPGPFTVFAPTDDAFKACKELDDLKKPENKAKLADFLKGHVVAKKIDAKKDKEVKPMHGADILLADKDGKVTVNEKIKVTKDLTASNGAIHVIDGVIMAAEKKPEAKPEIKKEEPKKEPAKPEAKKEEPKKEGEKKPEPKPGEKKG
jgi:uncharacterized surface protein with fasciclin (FAS1) repeats